MTEWRPENPLHDVVVVGHSFEHGKYIGFEAGASAMLSAVLKWLDEPCDKHEEGVIEAIDDNGEIGTIQVAHKDCPQYMAELRGEK